MAASGGGSREGNAKAAVADRLSQAVQSTANLLHLMQDSSPSQAHLIKLPKNLLAKVSTVKNTGQVLQQLPRVISSFDAHMESSLQRAPELKTVTQVLSRMENSQLKHAFPTIAEDKCSGSGVSSSNHGEMPQPTCESLDHFTSARNQFH